MEVKEEDNGRINLVWSEIEVEVEDQGRIRMSWVENEEDRGGGSWEDKSGVVVWAEDLEKEKLKEEELEEEELEKEELEKEELEEKDRFRRRKDFVQLLVDSSMVEIWYHSSRRVERKNSFHRDERFWSLLDVCEIYDVMKISGTRWTVPETRFWSSELRITAHRRVDEEDIV